MHVEPQHPEASPDALGNLHIFVNRRKFSEEDGVHAHMTGGQIAALVGVPPENVVVRLDQGPDSREVGIDETIDINEYFVVARKIVQGGHEPGSN